MMPAPLPVTCCLASYVLYDQLYSSIGHSGMGQEARDGARPRVAAVPPRRCCGG